MTDNLRIGSGFDIHPLVSGRVLVLGGVEVPYERGLSGWSDGDALTHAVIDAILGAVALGDIGTHFPPGDPAYKDISSLELLTRTAEKLREAGYIIINIDATVVADKPRLSDYIAPMRDKLAGGMGINPERVSVKASTRNGVAALGGGEAIAVFAVALIKGGEDAAL